MNRHTRVSLAAIAAATIIPLSGCAALISPQQTAEYEYAAGDGKALATEDEAENRIIIETPDDVAVRDIKLVGTTAAAPAQLMYTIANMGDSAASLSFEVNGQESDVTVGAHETVHQYHRYTGDTSTPHDASIEEGDPGFEPIVIEPSGFPAGSLADVDVTINGQDFPVRVQVIGPSHHDYADFVPGGDPSLPPAERIYGEGEGAEGH